MRAPSSCEPRVHFDIFSMAHPFRRCYRSSVPRVLCVTGIVFAVVSAAALDGCSSRADTCSGDSFTFVIGTGGATSLAILCNDIDIPYTIPIAPDANSLVISTPVEIVQTGIPYFVDLTQGCTFTMVCEDNSTETPDLVWAVAPGVTTLPSPHWIVGNPNCGTPSIPTVRVCDPIPRGPSFGDAETTDDGATDAATDVPVGDAE